MDDMFNDLNNEEMQDNTNFDMPEDYDFIADYEQLMADLDNQDPMDILPELLEGHEQEFAEIHDLVYNLKIEHENKLYNVFLAHEPMLVKDKVLDENTVVCFGHIHKLCMIKPYGLCVSADAHNFTPISFEDVLYYHNCILNYYDENVFY